MDSRTSMSSINSDEIESAPRHRSGPIYKRGIDARTLNSRNIKHTFSVDDIVLPGTTSAEVSGPPSPQSGPPANFGQVMDGIYRSSFPQDSNIPFLLGLNLRTIITLVDTSFSPRLLSFFQDAGIQLYRFQITAHKTSDDVIPTDRIAHVLRLLQDPRNHPLLIHCNKGKHRTGCMVACLRKIQAASEIKPTTYTNSDDEPSLTKTAQTHRQHWPLSRILTEYHAYADPKARAYDEAFISAFDPQAALKLVETVPEISQHAVKSDSIHDPGLENGDGGKEKLNGTTRTLPQPPSSRGGIQFGSYGPVLRNGNGGKEQLNSPGNGNGGKQQLSGITCALPRPPSSRGGIQFGTYDPDPKNGNGGKEQLSGTTCAFPQPPSSLGGIQFGQFGYFEPDTLRSALRRLQLETGEEDAEAAGTKRDAEADPEV